MNVSLREITSKTVRRITDLAVAEGQEHFVARNAESLAEALFNEEAWYRAIYLDDEPAGFVMLYDQTLRATPPARPIVFIWRFMVDAKFQGRGVGRAALEQVVAHVRQKKVCSTLLLSYVPGPGGPEGFYRSFGFRPNGDVEDGEIVLELLL